MKWILTAIQMQQTIDNLSQRAGDAEMTGPICPLYDNAIIAEKDRQLAEMTARAEQAEAAKLELVVVAYDQDLPGNGGAGVQGNQGVMI